MNSESKGVAVRMPPAQTTSLPDTYQIYQSEKPARVGFQQLWNALSAVVQLDGGWVWVQDAEFRFTDITYGGPKRPRMSAESVTGRRRWDLPLEGVSPEALAEHQATCLRHEPFSCFEYRIRNEDGVPRWISVSGSPYHDDDGHFLGYLGVGRDVSPRHALEDELWEWEQRLRGFAEYSPGWFWEQDAEFRFTRFWGQSIEKTHISISQTLGKTRWEMGLQGVSPEQMAAHRATLERHAAFHDFQYMLRAGDSPEEWYSISGRPTFDRNGAFSGYRGAGNRITTHKVLQDTLARQRQVIAALNEMATGLAGTHGIGDVLHSIVERARTLASAESGFVYLLDDDGQSLELMLALGAIEPFLGLRLAPGEGLSGIVWQTARPLVVNDYDRWPWRSRQFQNSGILSIAGVPLTAGSRVIGVLGVVHLAERSGFDDSVLGSLEAFAPLASLALSHARQAEALEAARHQLAARAPEEPPSP